MKLFFSFLHQKRLTIAVFLIFCLIYSVSSYLYRLPAEAIIYPLLLCLVTGVIALLLSFRRAAERHNIMKKFAELPCELIEKLPTAESISDGDYQQIIDAIRSEQKLFADRMTAQYSDMVDYYTVWAHQIKTPLASMRLRLQNEDSPLSRSLSSDLFRIEQYVEMVLTFMRLGSDSSDYVIKEYELDSIIRQCVKKFSGEFIERRLSLSYEPFSARIITDEKWLSFVIEQILSNSLKYTRMGGITISLEQANVLCFTDTGIGIAPEDIPRVFQKGYTGFNGRDDRKATGIGLYLCKRICDNLGIGISVESEIDKGTTVKLDFSQPKRVFE